jgi:hypothetical protein
VFTYFCSTKAHSYGVHGQGMRVNSDTDFKTLKGLKHSVSCVCEGRKPHSTQVLPIQGHYRASHFYVVPCTSLQPGFGTISASDRRLVPRNISEEFISHVMMKFRLLWENGFEYNLELCQIQERLEN